MYFCVSMSVLGWFSQPDNLTHAVTALHVSVHNISSYAISQVALMLVVLLFPVRLFCPDGGIRSHDQREEKKQVPHRQRGGSVWWGAVHIVCLCTWGTCVGDVAYILCSLLDIKIMSFPHRLFFLCLVSVTLFNCSVGRQDCSRCRTADPKYGCVWCGGAAGSRCVYRDSCNDEVQHTCPAPVIHFVRSFLPAFEHFVRNWTGKNRCIKNNHLPSFIQNTASDNHLSWNIVNLFLNFTLCVFCCFYEQEMSPNCSSFSFCI